VTDKVKPDSSAPFSNALREVIAAHGLSAYKLASASGIDRSNISKWLKRESDLMLGSADRLAVVLGLQVTAAALDRGEGASLPRARPSRDSVADRPPVLDLSRGPQRAPYVRGVCVGRTVSRRRWKILRAMLRAGCGYPLDVRLSGPELDKMSGCNYSVRELTRMKSVPLLGDILVFPKSKNAGGYGLAME